jgi:4-amino-4-deoxy-L-arabinose transferase-like glycosyltransferase
MNRLNPWITLGLLTVILHAAVLFLVIPQLTHRVMAFYNQDRYVDGYDQLAQNLVLGNGYRFYPDTARTMMREPGYPILLAGLMFLWGNSFAAVKIANLCLALATAWLMTRLAARMSSSWILQVLPPLLFLFHPATLIAESRGGVETLFAFLLILFLLALYTALERADWRYFALTGTVLGLTVLVRSTPMLFPLFLLGYFLVAQRQQSSALAICRNITVMIVAMFTVLSPWIVRNYRLSHKFVPTASVLGVSAHAGEYLCTHRTEDKPWFLLDRDAAAERFTIASELGYPYKDVKDGYYQSFYSTSDELRFSSYLAARVFGEYKSNPLLCVRCMAYNLFNFWFAGKSWMSTTGNVLVQLPYMILAVVGVVACSRNRRFAMIGPIVLLVLYVMAVHAPILAQARYSVPLIPLLSILASFVFAERTKSINAANAAATIAVERQNSTIPASLVGSGTEK